MLNLSIGSWRALRGMCLTSGRMGSTALAIFYGDDVVSAGNLSRKTFSKAPESKGTRADLFC
jgi:hypothetical protein